MKLYLQNYKNISKNGKTINLQFENGNLSIKYFSQKIIHFEYSFNEIKSSSSIEKGRKFFCNEKNLKNKDVEVKEEKNNINLLCDQYNIIVDKISGNIAVNDKKTTLHGGLLGNLDTVIPGQQLRYIGSDKLGYIGKFNFPLNNNDQFYGLGDKSGLINRAGKEFKMYNRDSLGYDASNNDPLYKSIPFFIKQNKNNFIGLLFDHTNIDSINLGKESPFYYSVKVHSAPLSYYLILGSDYQKILNKYYLITGFPTLPPLSSFGFFGSSMNYVEGNDAKERILKYFETIDKYSIPCEGMYVSSGYLKAKDGKRYAFIWNKDKFPDYNKFIKDLNKRKYTLLMNIKPGFLVSHPWYKELSEKGFFIKDANGNPYVEYFWGGNASLFDFSNEQARNWWKEKLIEVYLDNGCKGIWNDNNEFEIEDFEIETNQTKTIYPLLMAKTAYEAFSEKYPTERPWIYSRSGYCGIQKYARTWTGDNCSDWKSLKYNQFMGVSLGLSGCPFFGHDLGGFFGERPEEELLVRSCESAVFQSRFVIHSWREDDIPTEPWTYKKALKKIKNLITDHYSFLPYIYSNAYQTSQNGVPLERSLYLEFKDSKIKNNEVNTLFGNDILKITIVHKGINSKSVYLPKNTNWYDKKGNIYQGGHSIDISCPLGESQYLIREGSIIATTSKIGKLSTSLYKEVDFTIYPTNKGKRKGLYFEDDGCMKLKYKKYNEYLYWVYKDYILFKKNKCGIVSQNRIFNFYNSKGNLIYKINPDAIKKGETLKIELKENED